MVLLGIAVAMCSCTPRGGDGAQGKEIQEGKNSGDSDHAPSGEHVWNLTELPKPESAVRVTSLKYLSDGAVRISTGDAHFEHAAVMDSRDGGRSWEAADAATSPELEDEVIGKYYSAKGVPFAYSSMELILSADSGTEEKAVRMEEGETIFSADVSADTLAVLVLEEMQFHLKIYDLQTMECRYLEDPELSEFLARAADHAGGQISLDSQGNFLYIEGTGIGRYDLTQDRFGYLIGEELYDELINPNQENGLIHDLGIRDHFAVKDGEDQVLLSVSSPVSEQSKLYLLERGAPKEEKQVQKEKLRIYSLKESAIRQAATLFQEKYPELEVTFEIGCTGGNGVTPQDAIRTLNTELMAGEGPDILILDGLPADSYAKKGMLEDLTDLVEPDKENYFYNIISAYNGGERIYQMPLEFCVPVILGDADTVAVKNRRELMEVLRKKAGTGIPFMVSKNISEAALELFITSDIAGETINEVKLADYYRDLDTIADLCFSDGERDLFPVGDKMAYWAEQYPGVGFCPELDLYFGEAQAGITRIEALWDYMKILPLCREKGLSYQYLNRENGNYFIAVSVLGISSGGKNPDAAKQFLRFYLSGETYGDGAYPYFPVIRELAAGSRYVSEEGESVGGTSRKHTPDQTMDMYKLTPAELKDFTAFLDGLDTPVKDDAVVMQKVMEQAEACLFKGKDPESAAADACREVNLYLSE